MIEKFILPAGMFLALPMLSTVFGALEKLAKQSARKKAFEVRPDLAHTDIDSLSAEQQKDFWNVFETYYYRHPLKRISSGKGGYIMVAGLLTSFIGAVWLIILLGASGLELVKPWLEKIL